MSISSSEDVQEGCSRFPNWVKYSFLKKTFFEKCERHKEQKNELINRYCISCDESICRYCIGISGCHDDHNILTIYRHVYQNVVPLGEMKFHMDCDQIQPYKCNKKWVVSLTPLPHNGSGSLIDGDGSCYICRRKLTDPDHFSFCSIACKVEWESRRKNGKFIEGEEKEEVVVVVGSKRKRRHSRKGVPHRAPLS